MDGYIQTTIGIVVSVILFLMGYRQTIGARRERVGAANKAVYKALLRRLVLENYTPRVEDINRLIEGKAQDFKVSSGDLHPDEQVLNQVFAEIFDNDFIPPDKRSEIEQRVGSAFDQLAKGKQRTTEIGPISPDQKRKRALLIGALGLLASLMGAMTFLLLTLGKIFPFSEDISAVKSLLPALAVFVASLVSVVAISVVKRVREAPEEAPSRVTAASDAASLEHEVASTLAKLGLPFQVEPKIGLLRPDFIVELGGKRIVLEVKAWRSPPPLGIVARVARYLQEVLKSDLADEAVVVTRARIPAYDRLADAERIQFVAMKDLTDWLKGRR